MAPPQVVAGHRPGPTNVVIVSKVPETITKEQLVASTGRAGDVLQASFWPSDLEGPGWAIIAFASPELAKAAKERLDAKALSAAFATAGGPLLEASLGEGLFGNLRGLGGERESPWKEARTPQGHVYYFHSGTRQTTWVKPPPDFAPAAAVVRAGSPPPMRAAAPVQGQAAFQAAQAAVTAAAAPGTTPTHTNLNSGPIGANLFIYHIPNSWDDNILRQHFEHFGKLISARVQTDNDGRSRGFGFVSFDAPGAAQAAIAGMHGFPVDGKHLKVQLKKGDEQQMQPGGPPSTAVMPPVGGLLDIHQPPPPFGAPPMTGPGFGAPGSPPAFAPMRPPPPPMMSMGRPY